MLPKNQRLRKAKDFALLSQKGRVVFAPFFTMRFRPSALPTKVGFVVSAKVFKTAVRRNRAKRRMREVLRAVRPVWPEKMDLLFILKPETMTAGYEELVRAARRTFEKVPEALARPPVPRRDVKARRKTSVVYKENREMI